MPCPTSPWHALCYSHRRRCCGFFLLRFTDQPLAREGTMKKIVHVVGTGTIGEPLLGLFTDFRDRMGIDEVTFHKRTPLASDRAKLNHLIRRGAKLAVDEDVRQEFEKLGHEVSLESREALERATVIVDCTPAGNENKEKFYENLTGPKGFLAQGSEFGFGKPYAQIGRAHV